MKTIRMALAAALLSGLSIPAAAQDAEEKGQYKKWLEREVVWIISEKEKEEFKSLDSKAEKKAFIEQFWQRRDPTPSTPRNEYKEEHYRRWIFANKHFAEGVPGWKADRGRVYIIHGPPDGEYYHQARNVMSPNRELKSTDRSPDSIVWVYHQLPMAKHFRGEMRVVFQRAGGLTRQNFVLGESHTAQERADELERMFFPSSNPNWMDADVRYRLTMAGPPGIINARGAELPTSGTGDFAKHVADLFRSPGELLEEEEAERLRRSESQKQIKADIAANVTFDSLQVGSSWESYFLKGEEWMLPVEISFPAQGLQGHRLDIYTSLLDSQGQVFDEFLDSVNVPEDYPLPQVTYQNRFLAPKGEYVLRTVLRDVESQSSGLTRHKVKVGPQQPSKVAFGSVFLTNRVEVDPPEESQHQEQSTGSDQGASLSGVSDLVYQGVRLLPMRTGQFTSDSHLYLYFQYWVPSQQQCRVVLAANFIHQGQIVKRIPPTEMPESAEGGNDYGTVIPLQGFEAGEYVLQLQLMNLEAGSNDFHRVTFEIGG
ncbi:MAG TPA: GWxTD domain-containing protein [Acidobacteriota bacterium]|nr:GWxTD domain-containing protein [Acidobacteriota bacterium]